MAVQRSGPTPFFYAYITENALIPQKEKPSEKIFSASTGLNIQWMDIPNYQRGISWDVSTVEELLDSSSILLGNVILGQFGVGDRDFKYIPDGIRSYVVLVDGLQRFSVGTALLACLYSLVLKEEPDRPELKSKFAALSARINQLSPIIMHNDKELRYHPRNAVAEAYNSFKNDVKIFLEAEFDSVEVSDFCDKINNLFLKKQVAVDLYFNFSSPIEIVNTFIGINTVRIDLSPVDLLRSFIVEKAFTSKWQATDIEVIENRITDTFTERDKPRSELLPFVSILLKYIRSANDGSIVFPSWKSDLIIEEVENLIKYVNDFLSVDDCSLLDEIRACGAIPLAGILSHYYYKFVHTSSGEPAFFSGKKQEYQELHFYLRATYRQLINGTVGKARNIVEKLFKGELETLREAANQISTLFIKMPIDQQLDESWLKTNLKKIDQKRARRVFNALRLPNLDSNDVLQYQPDIYGSKAKQYHIDHLIPISTVDEHKEGALEAQTILNFAPLPSSHNRKAKATPCSSKLNKDGLYGNYLSANINPHPYSEWLVHTQSSEASNLDLQELLEPNSEPPIGTVRLDWLAKELRERI